LMLPNTAATRRARPDKSGPAARQRAGCD